MLAFLVSCRIPAARADDLKLDKYGGCAALRSPKGPGKFFRVEKIADRYWFVTPDGNAFWSLGPCVVQWQDGWGGSCPKLGGFCPNPFANRVKYGDDVSLWRKAMEGRFAEFGWNTEAAWGVAVFRDIPDCTRVLFISDAARSKGARVSEGGHPFADVFDPRFEEAAGECAKQLGAPAVKDSPWVLGSFPDNEIPWEGTDKSPDGKRALPDDFIALPKDAPGKLAWLALLKKKYGDVAKLNEAWGSAHADWVAVVDAKEVPDDPKRPAIFEDKVAFMRAISERYYRVVTGAMRKNDPNHLVFGPRFALWGGAFEKTGRQVPFHEVMWEEAGKYLDVVAINCYHDPNTLEKNHAYFARVFEKAKKPVCITEWAVIAKDSHFPATNGWVASQAERSRHYAMRLQGYLDLAVEKDPNDGKKASFCMGAHWFQCYDEPSLGRPDGEANNFGLFTAQDEPFLAFLNPAAAFNRRIYPHLVRGEPMTIPAAPEVSVATDAAKPRADWTPVEGAASYAVLLSPVASMPGDGMSLSAAGLKQPGWSPDPGLPQGTWHVSVQAVDAEKRGGWFSLPKTLAVGSPAAAPAESRPFFKFEDLRLWKNRDGDGPGIAVAFPEDRPKFAEEGRRCARVVFTPLSLDRATGKPNDRTAKIAWAWAGKPLDMKDRRFVEFAVQPARVCTFPPKPPAAGGPASGVFLPSTRFVALRLADSAAGKELLHPLDPEGKMKEGKWTRVKVDVTGPKFDRLDTIEWLIDCADPQVPWDQRVIVWLDDFTALPFKP